MQKLIHRICEKYDHLSTNNRIVIFFAMYLGTFAAAFASEAVIFSIFGKHSDQAMVAALIAVGYWLWFASWIFLFVSSWAAKIHPAQAAKDSPEDPQTLRARLLDLNNHDLPFGVTEDKNGNLIAEWKIADDRWLELLQANGLEFQHQIVMKIDESNKRVRALDLEKKVSWYAGVARMGWSFSYFRGITLWQYERAAEIGLIYKDGSWGIKPAYNYRFYLAEMKNPIIECVTQSGWTFFPVMFLSGPFAAK